MNMFDKCKECKKCCHNRQDNELIIPLTTKESVRFGKDKLVILKGKDCEYLGEEGCVLKESKPIVCSMFPIIFKDEKFSVFDDCPLADKFKEQMQVGSEQSDHYLSHLSQVSSLDSRDKKRINKLYRRLIWK